jgi:hypothetical protein
MPNLLIQKECDDHFFSTAIYQFSIFGSTPVILPLKKT